MKVRIVNKSPFPLPQYQTEQSAGLDLKAVLEESIVLQPLERTLVGTGLFIELPDSYEAQIRPRSGMAFKQGVTVLNSPGTIDADYRGEVGIVLINHGEESFVVQPLARIAQLVIAPVVQAQVKLCDGLEDTERGSRGYGSTGEH